VSRAVMRAMDKLANGTVTAAESVQEVPGRGVCAMTHDGTYLLGRADWLRQRNLNVPVTTDNPRTEVWVARNDKVLGSLLMADLPRPEAKLAIDELRGLGLNRVTLLTGDRWHAAHEVARQLDIEHVIAEVLPVQKLQTVQEEKQS